MLISGHRSEYLVGTEHYHDAIAGARNGDPVRIELWADSSNPHDPNAVAGRIQGKVVGHLRKESAAKLHKPIADANALGFTLFVATRYRKRDDGSIGVGWLDIPGPDALAKWLRLPETERVRGFDFPGGKSPNTPRSIGKRL